MQPLKPRGTPSFLYSPVQNCLKFSAVRGTVSANSSILMRPASCFFSKILVSLFIRNKLFRNRLNYIYTVVPIVMSKKTTGFAFVVVVVVEAISLFIFFFFFNIIVILNDKLRAKFDFNHIYIYLKYILNVYENFNLLEKPGCFIKLSFTSILFYFAKEEKNR